MPVAMITDAEVSDRDLGKLLAQAETRGFQLLYWATRPQRAVPEELLRAYGGSRINRRVEFVKELAGPPDRRPLTCVAAKLAYFPKSAPSRDMIELAYAAGQYSRFRLDPRISSEKAFKLYETWIVRSTLVELADVVIVAREANNREVGLVTVSGSSRQATIGLIAVDPDWREKRLGSSLLEAAEQWAGGRGIPRVSVATQLENGPACRLYQKSGYLEHSRLDYYHFWPSCQREA
jgi:dTDP-4-amino-4,6-dideoxy-D-galactose acyltransferase